MYDTYKNIITKEVINMSNMTAVYNLKSKLNEAEAIFEANLSVANSALEFYRGVESDETVNNNDNLEATIEDAALLVANLDVYDVMVGLEDACEEFDKESVIFYMECLETIIETLDINSDRLAIAEKMIRTLNK